jgi:hypothetical protein
MIRNLLIVATVLAGVCAFFFLLHGARHEIADWLAGRDDLDGLTLRLVLILSGTILVSRIAWAATICMGVSAVSMIELTLDHAFPAILYASFGLQVACAGLSGCLVYLAARAERLDLT